MGTARQHDVDFYQWTQDQAALLRAMRCNASPLDRDNLVEEVEDMGRAEIREISSLLRQTIAHLVKTVIVPNAASVASIIDSSPPSQRLNTSRNFCILRPL
jgi:hypothetical protein